MSSERLKLARKLYLEYPDVFDSIEEALHYLRYHPLPTNIANIITFGESKKERSHGKKIRPEDDPEVILED